MGEKKGTFVVADMEKEAKIMQELINSDPELKEFSDEWDKEYKRRLSEYNQAITIHALAQ